MNLFKRLFSRDESILQTETDQQRPGVPLPVVDPHCPHCGFDISPPPTRRRKCPSCREQLYIRWDAEWGTPGRQKHLLTQKEFDAAERKTANENWARLGKEVHEAALNSDFKTMGRIYFQMGLQLKEEGKDFSSVLEESARSRLRHYASMDWVNEVRISTNGESACDECRPLDGKVLSISEALEKMPVPVATCQSDLSAGSKIGWCQCDYRTVSEYE